MTELNTTDFHLPGNEVYIKKIGNTIVLISTDNPWQSLFESLDKFSDDFMITREQPPLDIREDKLSGQWIC